MSKLHNKLKSLSAAALLALSSLAEAGTIGSFTFLPGSATAVPALSDALLVVLGLLMIVIAVRTLKANSGYQKFLSVAVLAGGLLIGGLGAERTLATSTEFTAGEDGISCEEASTKGYDPFGTATLSNGCTVPGAVENSLDGTCTCGYEEIQGTCDGATLGKGDVCTLRWCQFVENCDG